MKQAISYANADSIKAEFAVFTNGDIWQVKRNTEAGWVSYPNIPRLNGDNEINFEFNRLLFNLDEIKPVLNWLYQPLSGLNAIRFIQAIQPIFCSSSIITTGTNSIILEIIDNTCRGITIKPDIDGYHIEKLTTAFKQTQSFLQELEIKNYVGDDFEYNLQELLRIPDRQLTELNKQFTYCDSEMDHAGIQLLSALYSEARKIVAVKSVEDIVLSSALTDSLYNFIDLGLQRNLQTCLPQKSDTLAVNDIRDSCSQDWVIHTSERETNLLEICFYYINLIKNRIWH